LSTCQNPEELIAELNKKLPDKILVSRAYCIFLEEEGALSKDGSTLETAVKNLKTYQIDSFADNAKSEFRNALENSIPFHVVEKIGTDIDQIKNNSSESYSIISSKIDLVEEKINKGRFLYGFLSSICGAIVSSIIIYILFQVLLSYGFKSISVNFDYETSDLDKFEIPNTKNDIIKNQ